MNRIEAIVNQPFVEPIERALKGLGISDVEVAQVCGFVSQRTKRRFSRGAFRSVAFARKWKLEVAVFDEEIPVVVEAIRRIGRTNVLVDGRVYGHIQRKEHVNT